VNDPRLWLIQGLLPLWLALSGGEVPVDAADLPKAPRSLVLMISDGFGPASLTLARTASATPLHLDRWLVGSVATASSDSHITDSAASATALASGSNTSNRVVGLDPAGGRLTNLMELARAAGLRTGVVTTTSVTHATPAAFSAHMMSREDELAIAVQQLDCGLDVFLGGGRDFFTSVRPDGRDLLAAARAGGWLVVETPGQLAAADTTPLLGVFTPGHFAYRIDVDAARAASSSTAPAQPTLAEMTTRALEFLAAGGAPFVLVVEGGRIDHAAHDNDVASHLLEIQDYDEAVGVALEFAESNGQTLVVSVSDHETGGLTLGRNHGLLGAQNWDPSKLRLQTASFERMIARMQAGENVWDVFRAVGGVADLDGTEAERMKNASALVPGLSQVATESRALNGLSAALMAPLARRVGVEWGTWWHTAVDVPLFAAGVGRERLVGHRTHAELGRLLREMLGLGEAPVGSAEDGSVR
jgi:alkaline phosphatase